MSITVGDVNPSDFQQAMRREKKTLELKLHKTESIKAAIDKGGG